MCKYPYFRVGRLLAKLANILRVFGFPLIQISFLFENGDEKIYSVTDFYVSRKEGYHSAVSMPYERSAK